LHAALLSRRHPLQIPPPQFRGSCQCVGSLVSYKVLSVHNRAPKGSFLSIAIHESGQSNRRMRHTTSRLQHGWHRILCTCSCKFVFRKSTRSRCIDQRQRRPNRRLRHKAKVHSVVPQPPPPSPKPRPSSLASVAVWPLHPRDTTPQGKRATISSWRHW
jgi:hypothetical protein